MTLLLEKSWLGNEDHALEPAIKNELPAILNWALDGLARLEEQEAFTRPASADGSKLLVDLASPVKAFIRDRCIVGPEHEIAADDLWNAWKQWAEDNGHRSNSVQRLGRDLRAALPRVRVVQLREGDDRRRAYRGLGLAQVVEQTP